jgi:hypothetical protein
MMAAFILVCSVVSFSVLRKSTNVSYEALTGLKKLIVVSSVLLISITFEITVYFLTSAAVYSVSLIGYWLPEWIRFGLTFIVFHIIGKV